MADRRHYATLAVSTVSMLAWGAAVLGALYTLYVVWTGGLALRPAAATTVAALVGAATGLLETWLHEPSEDHKYIG